jgi:hypothetical protein
MAEQLSLDIGRTFQKEIRVALKNVLHSSFRVF